jgi:site-specific DNA-methyltransferase (adenine-specific)
MITIKIGDCREVLKKLPDKSVHGCVTSPPYFRLRRYCKPGTPESEQEIGQEQTPQEYINELVEVFREVKRVLRDDGTLFINIKDCYDKNHELRGIPWKLVFALKDDGWRHIQEIIWNKPNCMPESVTKRCTSSHESIFFFTKSKNYYYDNEAIKEPLERPDEGLRKTPAVFGGRDKFTQTKEHSRLHSGNPYFGTPDGMRNKRSVWSIPTVPYKKAHFAVFPPKLAENCLKSGTSEHGVCSQCGAPYIRITEKNGYTAHGGPRKRADAPGAEVSQSSVFRTGHISTTQTVGWQPSCACNAPITQAVVLDPFGGSGTVGQWCQWNNRDCILIELNPEYKHLIEERINEPPKQKKTKKKKTKPCEKFTLQQNLTTYFSS